ncbi:orotidine-5'-phosphate decarboxylase [Bacillus alveayuensis]|uniref:orotidine-5'-phosphate decarboxylase n=1 Tax=Aeribacillus alveayuensis TaxID=279215 RepID=UPI0005D12F60|nr:orotidine-5'-phosphate decarboxylase [Bacillus alveayuensis]
MNNPLIVALDFSSIEEVKRFLQPFQGEPLFVKVGMELYYQEGPAIISYLKEQGQQIFLDLKLHDIPNTVKQAMKGIARLGVDLINVHAAGGMKMMEAALEGLEVGTETGKRRPYCIAVTQLTSTSEQMLHDELLIERSLEETVLHYASLAQKSGLDGVVCSAKEVPLIRERLGAAFLTVTPGIRFSADEKNDQVRVVTPYEAKLLGASAIVVGRSITMAANPYEAYKQLQQEWNGGEEK